VINELLEKLKQRWGVEHFWQVVLIMFIFSICGMTVLYIREFVFDWLGLGQSTPLWEEAVAWLVIVFPSYQILFLFYGFIFGQFEFVWRFEKKNFRRLKGFFLRLLSKL
jgi:hypothetical protein